MIRGGIRFTEEDVGQEEEVEEEEEEKEEVMFEDCPFVEYEAEEGDEEMEEPEEDSLGEVLRGGFPYDMFGCDQNSLFGASSDDNAPN